MSDNEKPRLATGALLNQAPTNYHTPEPEIKSSPETEPGEPQGSNYELAHWLASQGHHVFPCQNGGEKVKQPCPGVKWKDKSTCDAAQIRRFWQAFPNAAPGIDLGKSKWIVVDTDRKPGGPDGVAAWQDLLAEHGDPGAPAVRTPSGGLHFYFKQPEGWPPLGKQDREAAQGHRCAGRWRVRPSSRHRPGGRFKIPAYR
jgi:hypothetical protein